MLSHHYSQNHYQDSRNLLRLRKHFLARHLPLKPVLLLNTGKNKHSAEGETLMTGGTMAATMPAQLTTQKTASIGIVSKLDTSLVAGQVETLHMSLYCQPRTGLISLIPTRETSSRGQLVPAR